MRILKSDFLSLLMRTLPREGGFGLAVSAYACFSLREADPGALLPEADMWGLLRKALQPYDIFDQGYPKPAAEFLLYGRCHPQEGATGTNVSVRVGGLRKTLQVMGPRTWQGDHCSAPEPLEPIRLDWTQAYGGPEYPYNPLGKGHTRRAEATGLDAPQILLPNELLTRPDQEHEPASFTALPPFWPQRAELLGAFDAHWQYTDWPYFPSDSKAEYFCTAQPDQRFDHFFDGNEPLTLTGVHPRRQTIQARLPGLRARLFALPKQGGAEAFAELPALADTLWLLPEQEAAIVCYRGVLQQVDEDAEDVAHLVADWEPLDSPPLPAEHYWQWLCAETTREPEPEPGAETLPLLVWDDGIEAEDTGAGVAADAEKKAEKDAAPGMPQPGAPEAELSPEQASIRQQAEAFAASVDGHLAKLGLTREDTEAFLQSAQPDVENPYAGLGIEESAAALQRDVQALLARRGLDLETVERFLQEKQLTPSGLPGLPSLPSPPDPVELERFFTQALANPSLAPAQRSALQDMRKATSALDGVFQQLAQQDEHPPKAARAKDFAFAEPARPEVLTSFAGKDFSGADFSGRNLSRVNFQDAVLRNVNFSKAVLAGTDFSGAILSNANFMDAHLVGAQLARAQANGAKCNRADLLGANLEGADFSESDFSNASFDSAILDRCDFSNAVLRQINAVGTRAENASFEYADLTGASFVGALLKQANFSHAVLHNVDFSEAKADKTEFYGAYGKDAVFRNASMVNSRADGETRFPCATMRNADLRDARWSGANLKGANLWNVTMDCCDFSKSVLDATVLVRVKARWANVAKASIEGANMRRINLFRGSLRKARVVNARIQLANLFGVDMYGLRIINTAAEDSNKNRTLRERTSDDA